MNLNNSEHCATNALSVDLIEVCSIILVDIIYKKFLLL